MRRLSRVPLNGKQGNCGHTVAIFTFRPSGQNAKICLLGSLPKPGFGPTWPEMSASLCSLFSHPLTFLLLLPARLRIAQQIINVCLRCRDFPHFIFLQKGQGGGHLFQVENLGPPLIPRPLPLELRLNVDNQVDPMVRLARACSETGEPPLYPSGRSPSPAWRNADG